MGFKKMNRVQFPPRMWSLVGFPGSGKSTFAAQMKGPTVVIDADHRFQEVLEDAQDPENIFELSEDPSDNVDPNQITRALNKNMPRSGVKTIVVDSLTAIITPIVVQAMIDNDNGSNKNLIAGFRTKALAMRQLQDAVSRWGCDVLWIYHLQRARDAKAREITRATVSDTELARLTRSINVQLEVVEKDNRRGIKVIWARRGRSGTVLWDETGAWKGMPEKIEEMIYGGLSKKEQDSIEKSVPSVFRTPEHAVDWAINAGAFKKPRVALDAYNQLKKDRTPGSAQEMAQMWIELAQERGSTPEESASKENNPF